jgi:hypothetical protein
VIKSAASTTAGISCKSSNLGNQPKESKHGDAMTPEEALRNILKLVDGSDEVEDAHALQILLQSIKTLAEKGLGRSN